jgi:hypothetical protein
MSSAIRSLINSIKAKVGLDGFCKAIILGSRHLCDSEVEKPIVSDLCQLPSCLRQVLIDLEAYDDSTESILVEVCQDCRFRLVGRAFVLTSYWQERFYERVKSVLEGPEQHFIALASRNLDRLLAEST